MAAGAQAHRASLEDLYALRCGPEASDDISRLLLLEEQQSSPILMRIASRRANDSLFSF
jgi:hypothetical protein